MMRDGNNKPSPHEDFSSHVTVFSYENNNGATVKIKAKIIAISYVFLGNYYYKRVPLYN